LIVTQLFTAIQHDSFAQFVPIPPPAGNPPLGGNHVNSSVNDKEAPKLDIITLQLKEGKNVFKINLNDDSGVASAYLKYVNKGQIKTQPMTAMGGDLYEALVDIHPPSRIVEIQATDMNGNTVDTYAQYNVAPSNDITKLFSNLFGQLWNSTPSNP